VTDDARAELVLDIRGRTSAAGWEDGLLGLAFHPRFVRNRYVYVLYTGLREQLVLSRFSVPRSGEGAADPGSEVVILEIEKPHPNHNGGQLAFGRDGFLYIGLGDGGEPGNGQDLQTLLGSILRIDIDHAEDGRAYGIPEDNPFHGVSGAREEIWAYGFRNPWRFSFEPGTGRLWVADPGEQGWDEINLAEPGLNYGWPLIEGDECHDAADKCEGTKLVRPLVTHQLYTAGNCALIGGLVYRAEALPGLKDAYIYGDFCTGAVWGLRYNNGAVAEHQLLAQTNLPITSFGVDAARDLLFVTHQGEIYALVLAPGAGTVSEDSSGSAG
jgi:glucose/arabinose dehydrogenase